MGISAVDYIRGGRMLCDLHHKSRNL